MGPILIIDDEPQNLAVMRQILSPDYDLVFATDGPGGIAAALKHQPTLILLDISMPGMDGYAVCRALKADPRTEAMLVIFVTALADVGNEAAGFEVGAVDYIVKPVMPAIVKARVKAHLSLVRLSQLETSYRDAISMLGDAGHYNDNDTGVHIWRMADFAMALAAGKGWSPETCRMMQLAAPMHDTGKIGIPREILAKPGALTAEEWLVMKTHSQIGHDILARSHAPVFRLAAEIALHHHEKWDGGGYPRGLAGQDIPESARIVAIADVFDALSMRRPYKDSWSYERVMQTIQAGAGSHFDPEIVALFVAIQPQIVALQAKWTRAGQADDPYAQET
jgi:putative two-component system response regulator